MHEILEGLNDKQLIAANYMDGPEIVLAGPGTGKTQLMAARIIQMLSSDLDIKPTEILSMTFTDSGAHAIRKRLVKYIGTEAYKVHIHTFHSFCNDVVQSNIDYFKVKNIEPATDLEIINVLYKILRELPNDHIIKRLKGANYIEARRLKNLFATMKNENWSADHIKTQCREFINSLPENENFIYKRGNSKKYHTVNGVEKVIETGDPNMRLIDLEKEKLSKLVAAAYLIKQYDALLAEAGRYDYSDMILWVINAFREREYLLLNYQERFQWVLIDEFQDTNGSQNELISLLMGFWDNPNLFVVGDPNQCHPAGVDILTNNGYKKIEKLTEKDRVVCYDKGGSYVIGFKDGYKINLGKRKYTGKLYNINSIPSTDNHKFLAKWNKTPENLKLNVVYLMRKDGWFRIGWCQLFNAPGGFHLGTRARLEEADSAWILGVYNTKKEASLKESFYSVKFGIPTITFTGRNSLVYYDTEGINNYFNYFEPFELLSNAVKLLDYFNKSLFYPLWTAREWNHIGRVNNEICACNLIPGLMMIPQHIKGKVVNWVPIEDFEVKEVVNEIVYSLDVEKHHTYIANGFITHNCVYEFSGARIQNVVDFIKRYTPKAVLLNNNYRSNQHILDSAQAVISNNLGRIANYVNGIDEHLISMTNGNTHPVVIEYPNIAHEENAIINKISALRDQGVSMEDIGIIYRKHRQGDNIIKQLGLLGIPINVKRRDNVLDTIPVLQLIKILEFIIASIHDVEGRNGLFFEILHYKFFGVKHKTVQELFVKRKESIDHRASKFVVRVMKVFDELMNEYGNISFPHFIEMVLKSTGLLDYVMSHEDRVQLLLYLNTFMGFIKAEATKDGSLDIPKLLQLITEMRENDLTIPVLDIHFEEAGVNLMTAHGAKGLEFKYVFMMGCQRNEWEDSRSGPGEFSLPANLVKSVGEDKLESNRRLFYVGMTRAKEYLEISYAAKNNDGKDLEPSQFIIESNIPVTLKNSGDLTAYLSRQISQSIITPSIEHVYVTKVLEHYKLSVTHLNRYLECPVGFYYEYILKIPFVPNESLIYGSGIHAALQALYESVKSKSELSLEETIQVFYNYLEKYHGYLTKDIISRRSYLGMMSLTNYYKTIYPTTNKITLNEFKVKTVILNDVPFTGDIDKMEFNGSMVDIVDYKTGSPINTKSKLREPDNDHPYGGPLFRQLNIYPLMIKNMQYKDWRFNSARIVMIDKDSTTNLTVEVNDDYGKLMLILIKDVYTKIMNHEFSEGCNKPDCKWCNFQKQQI